MIDHTGINVSDLARSKAFYEKALQPRTTTAPSCAIPTGTTSRRCAMRPSREKWV
jgi:predicted enzyme related to lactoylglutathione lyase